MTSPFNVSNKPVGDATGQSSTNPVTEEITKAKQYLKSIEESLKSGVPATKGAIIANLKNMQQHLQTLHDTKADAFQKRDINGLKMQIPGLLFELGE